MKYKEYLKSKHWKDLRASYFKKTTLCEICWNKWKNLHHRTYKNIWKENLNELILLCKACHTKIHFWLWDSYYDTEIFYIKDNDLKYREDFVRVLRSKDSVYIEKNKQRKRKLEKIWKTDTHLQSTIWNNFIRKYWLQAFIDFCEIYKETQNVNDIFPMYWLSYDKDMALSFHWVIGHTKRFWFSIDDVIKYTCQNREF